jgi:DNA-directed RNA polymerase subunit RPC12/RpoP|nr:hypothetical protein [Enterococcus casseliflavus]
MKITQIQCPSCLGRLEVDWDSGKAVCQYCLNELLIKPEQKKTGTNKPSRLAERVATHSRDRQRRILSVCL